MSALYCLSALNWHRLYRPQLDRTCSWNLATAGIAVLSCFLRLHAAWTLTGACCWSWQEAEATQQELASSAAAVLHHHISQMHIELSAFTSATAHDSTADLEQGPVAERATLEGNTTPAMATRLPLTQQSAVAWQVCSHIVFQCFTRRRGSAPDSR